MFGFVDAHLKSAERHLYSIQELVLERTTKEQTMTLVLQMLHSSVFFNPGL